MAHRIYLAGPDVFFPEPLEVAKAHKAALARHGLEGVFPLDNMIPPAPPREMGIRLFEENCRLIDSCDAVIANMMPFRGPSTDVGTAWEMGYAFARQKPVVGYASDRSDYRDKVFSSGYSDEATSPSDRLGFAIEHFEVTDNLMLTGSALAIVSTIEEAAEFLAAHFGTKSPS